MTDLSEFEKLNIKEYLPILEEIKNNINNILSRRKSSQCHSQRNEDTSETDSEDNSKQLSNQLKAKRIELRQKDAEILNLENRLEDANDNCKRLEKSKKKISKELYTLKEVHEDCESKIESYLEQIADLKEKLKGHATVDTQVSIEEKYIEESETSPPFSSRISEDNTDSLDQKSVEIEKLKIVNSQSEQQYKDLLQIAEGGKLDSWIMIRSCQDLGLRARESQRKSTPEICHSRVLKEDDIISTCKQHEKIGCQKYDPSKKESSKGNMFTRIFWPATKEKTPYPEWWKKHMVP